MAFKISFDITEETCREIDQEASDAGLARSPYLKRIIEQRHEKGITIRPNDPSVTSRLEGIIEMLKEQNADLTDRLSRISEKAGLSGLERKNNVNETTLHEYGLKLKQEWQAELDQRELIELRKHKEHADARIRELEEHKDSNDKFDKTLSSIKEVVNKNPVILTGLMGMAGMKLPGEVPGLGSTPEDERALSIGRAVVNDIDPTIQDELMVVLNHLSKVPGDIAAIIKTKPFAEARRKAIADQQTAA